MDGLAEDPMLDFGQINSELALFDAELGSKPQVVALNKIDLPEVQARWLGIESELKKHGYKPYAISALARENLQSILFRAKQLLDEIPEVPESEEMPVYRVEEDPRDFTILRTPEGWRVTGVAIERAAAMTYWEYDQSAQRFQRILRTLGIEDALKEAGVEEGDSVFIGEFELEWQD